MKKLLFALLGFLSTLCASAANEAVLTVSGPRLLETQGRSAQVQFDVFLTNSVPVAGFQMRVKLPEGINRKDITYTLSDRVVNPNVLPAFYPISEPGYANESSAVVCSLDKSTGPLSVSGNNGKVMTVTFDIKPYSLHSDNYVFEFYDLGVDSPSVGSLITSPKVSLPLTVVSYLGDANLNRVVEVTDVDAVADMLLDKREYKAEANVQYTDDVMTIGDITALIELLKNN